jgi:hypothetical protein
MSPENTTGSKVLGAAAREDFGKQGGGLGARGLVHGERPEGSRELYYTITKEGRKELATALTEAVTMLGGFAARLHAEAKGG